MGLEIERKFKVKGTSYRQSANRIMIRQGFLGTESKRVIRVRIIDDDAFLTIKGKSKGAVRKEFEYLIPKEDAEILLSEFCIKPLIEKYRYEIKVKGLIWEVDQFTGDNDGLVLAEVELPDENYTLELPDWIAEEVTDDKRYYNNYLAEHPYSEWKSNERI